MAKVLHCGQVYEFEGKMDRTHFEEMKKRGNEVLVQDTIKGCTRIFKATDLRWIEEGELDKEAANRSR